MIEIDEEIPRTIRTSIIHQPGKLLNFGINSVENTSDDFPIGRRMACDHLIILVLWNLLEIFLLHLPVSYYPETLEH